MIEEILLEAEDKMDKAIDVARGDFGDIRSGRANSGMFEKIPVEYYGAMTPLQQLASITVPEARTVLIQPFDRSAMESIEKALRESDLGINPSNDGVVIRVIMPQLTEERRKEYVRLARSKAEDARVAIRAIRRKGKEDIDTLSKDGDVGEDAAKRAQDELDSLTKKHTDQVDSMLEAKEKELLEV
ncbi:MAG TPA: ribosome recycling factor [Beutenbergiaceae bacterium]|nr:ribosome recycling factor [Beutenbergiaceae bacterium]